MEAELERLLVEARTGRVVALTGAGISAESGIPTFRGTEGYWVVGSRNYMPEEMATRHMFSRAPDEVWRWYLYRFAGARRARPNAGHHALVTLERSLGERFTLVTQNIDGLHHRAGASRARTYCIHGEAAYVRCAEECTRELLPLPELPRAAADAPLAAAERRQLTCTRCGAWLRPHVLWFDEYYDEEYYRMESALAAASAADLLLVVGTSGATTLPMRIGELAFRGGAVLVDVNPEPNPFSQLAQASPRGFFARGTACERLLEIVRVLAA